MSASVIDLVARLQRPPDREKIIREDVRNALPGFHPARIRMAQERALRHWRRNVPLGEAINKALKWARNAIDDNSPLDAA